MKMKTKIITQPLPPIVQYIRIALKHPKPPEGELVCEERARVARKSITIDQQELRGYRYQCGFQNTGYLPFTYPFLLAFPLQSELFLSDAFPYAVMGLVHVRNIITQHKRIPSDATLDIDCTLIGPEKVYHGQHITFYTRIFMDGEVAWECRTVLLRRGRKHPDIEKETSIETIENPQRTVDWDVPALTGVRYALLGKDINPIHLFGFTARAFGFKKPIAHGMWAKAKAMAPLESHIKDKAAEVIVDFKLPMYLPGMAQLGYNVEADKIDFSLIDPEDGKPYLNGRVRYL